MQSGCGRHAAAVERGLRPRTGIMLGTVAVGRVVGATSARTGDRTRRGRTTVPAIGDADPVRVRGSGLAPLEPNASGADQHGKVTGFRHLKES
jgi:hypothetical protein